MKNDFILLVLCCGMVGGLADEKLWVSMPIDLLQIYHSDSLNLPCIWILYKRTFDAAKQLATGIVCMKRDLHHG